MKETDQEILNRITRSAMDSYNQVDWVYDGKLHFRSVKSDEDVWTSEVFVHTIYETFIYSAGPTWPGKNYVLDEEMVECVRTFYDKDRDLIKEDCNILE